MLRLLSALQEVSSCLSNIKTALQTEKAISAALFYHRHSPTNDNATETKLAYSRRRDAILPIYPYITLCSISWSPFYPQGPAFLSCIVIRDEARSALSMAATGIPGRTWAIVKPGGWVFRSGDGALPLGMCYGALPRQLNVQRGEFQKRHPATCHSSPQYLYVPKKGLAILTPREDVETVQDQQCEGCS